jgi:hypothetical protein
MKCLTWNLEWKTPASKAGRLIVEQVAAIAPDVACYTEVVRTLVPADRNDLTLKEAFQASCVPAFQNLARTIGPVKMQGWLDKIG